MALVSEIILQIHEDGTVTGFAGEQAQHSAAVETVTTAIPGASVVEDPWGQQAQPATTAAATSVPACVHGPLKAVKGGIAGPNSRNPGKVYGAFWACPAPRGAQCRLDPKSLPPVPAT